MNFYDWDEACHYARERYGSYQGGAKYDGYYICPACGEPIEERDFPKGYNFIECPYCNFNIEEDDDFLD